MPQIDWPRRYTTCGTLGQTDTTNRFFISLEDTKYFLPKDEVSVVASKSTNTASTSWPLKLDDNGSAGAQVDMTSLYLQQEESWPEMEFYLSTDEAGDHPVWRVPSAFQIYRNAGVVIDYPSLPMLTYPTAQSLTSNFDPAHIRPFVQSRPVFKGSVSIDGLYEEDGSIIQTFIDRLADPAAWFECPLPGNHLGSASVTAYDTATGEIQIPGDPVRQANHLRGWYARVGRRTCHIIEDDTIDLYKSHVSFALAQPASTIIRVPDDAYGQMTNGMLLVFISVDGIDGVSSADGGPEVGAKYYIRKRSDTNKEIELYKNSNLSGTRILFQQRYDPTNFHLNRFVLGGTGTYETHAIKIVPSYLIDGTTAQATKNNFSSTRTIRVRPTNISATGDPDFDYNPFMIEWIESDGTT